MDVADTGRGTCVSRVGRQEKAFVIFVLTQPRTDRPEATLMNIRAELEPVKPLLRWCSRVWSHYPRRLLVDLVSVEHIYLTLLRWFTEQSPPI